MSRPLTRAEIAALAADLRTTLERIEACELDATAAMRHRPQGAITVLEVTQGRRVEFTLEEGSA